MADADAGLGPEAIDRLLEAHEVDQARDALEAVPVGDDTYAIARIKLALYDGSLPSGAAMQQLIQLMRRDAAWPGAKELYQKASTFAYETRQSSVSHSHPPPPVQRKS